ncbi:CHAD domain-containing protein [Streptomyces sp. NPDC091266]|uniref:CYTH and CHAD domain-containing protein n=1 Tax=Streptomyces sp. NPDC091266 TaxID=3365978 RepID=UPI003813F564
MVDTVREIERKYAAADETQLPDLTGVPRIASVVERGAVDLDAVYYDTAEQLLAADGITLRRRTGGEDAGWHLKLPVAPGVRDEIRAALSDEPPGDLTALVRSRVLGRALVPVIRLRTRRTVRILQDAAGTPLAEVAVDAVRARRVFPGASAEVGWHEIEVELTGTGEGPGEGEGAGTGGSAGAELLDAVERALATAGIHPAGSASKLARALAETAPEGRPAQQDGARPPGARRRKHGTKAPAAGDVVLRYVRAQMRAIIELDPAVRRDLPDAVHRMRVATRRLRSAFRSYTKVLDRDVTRPIGCELKWLAGELGKERDQEVLTERLRVGLAELPGTLQLGPVAARLRIWSQRSRLVARQELMAELDGARYLALLESLHALLEDPPLLKAAARPAPEVLAKAVLKDYRRLAGRMATALDTPAGPGRDEALHRARKAAKRTRYAAEAARPALGKPAKKFTRRTKRVQQLLGDHHDSVVARATLRELALQAHRAGEGGFTFGLLFGREEARAARHERELPARWKKASRRKLRKALRP